MKLSTSAQQRFHDQVQKTTTCWLWTGALDRDGYGRFYNLDDKKGYRAHRIQMNIQGQDIPSGYVVMHKCDNPTCVNPDHLCIGTVAENNTDKKNKNRHHQPRGMKNVQSKLTDEQVKYIRDNVITLHRPGKNKNSNVRLLATQFNVHPETIRFIAKNKIWTHIV